MTEQRADMAQRPFPNAHSCPVRERTGDGVSVGRCYYHCPGDVCPRHGDVHELLKHYRATGELSEDPRP